MKIQITGLPDMPQQAVDTANLSQVVKEPEPTQLGYGTVGHADKNPQFARIEEDQVWIEVTMGPEDEEIVARLGSPSAGPDQGWYAPLSIGCQVIMMYVDGNPADAVIVGRLWDSGCPMPGSVAGVQTGAAGATQEEVSVGAPCWHFLKTASGQMLGIETGANGDILIHSAASVEIKAGSSPAQAIHLNGRVALGAGPFSPPTGKTVGPGNTEIPGVPAVAKIPDVIPAPVPIPFVIAIPPIGQDAIVRQKQHYQSNIVFDAPYWAFINALYAHPLIGPVLIGAGIVVPLHINSMAAGTRSQHTASD